jgi:hypothetical protein
MSDASHYDARTVRIRYSTGVKRVPYLEHWEDNFLRPPGLVGWPASLLRQVNAYVARGSWFSAEDAAALANPETGRISKF